MNKKVEERLFKLFRYLYNERKEVTLNEKWRKSLMTKAVGRYTRISPPFLMIPVRLGISMALVLLLACITLILTQYQLNSDMLSLAFELEQEF